MILDVEGTLKAILAALKAEAGVTFKNITPFAKNSLKGLTKQSAFLAQSRLDGFLSDADFQAEMADLEDQARIIAKGIAELVQIGLIKARNAIVDILKQAVRTALGTANLGFLVP
jgi:hypothetical protein